MIWALINNGAFRFANSESDSPASLARIMNLRDTVVEQGTLESQNTVNGICEIEGYENKIIFIVPEGSQVKEGDVVVKFDSAKATEEIALQEIAVNEAISAVQDAEQEVTVQKNENASSIRQAEQELEFAKIDLDKYIYGDFEVKQSEINAAISEAETEIDRQQRSLDNTRVLVKRGFLKYEQLRWRNKN